MSGPTIGALGRLIETHGAGAVQRSLSILLKAYAAAENVVLRYGKSAFTDGRTVWLPRLPFRASAALAEMVLGNLLHEILHIHFTQFDVWEDRIARIGGAIRNRSLVRSIANAIEDPRIEAVKQQRSPYYVKLIHNGRFHAAQLGQVRLPDSPSNALLVTIVLWGHIRNGMAFAVPRYADAETALRGYVGDDTANLILSVLEAGFPNLTSTDDVFDLTQQILTVLQSAADQQQHGKGDDSDGSAGDRGDSDESSPSTDGDADADAQSDAPQGAGDDDADGGSTDSDGMPSPSSEDDTDDDQSESTSTTGNAIQQLLEDEVDNPDTPAIDLAGAVTDQAESEVQLDVCNGTRTAGPFDDVLELELQTIDKDHSADYAMLADEARAQCSTITQSFLALMARARSRRVTPRTMGRPRPGRLAMAPMGVKPCGRRAESLVNSVAVGLLVDASGSMLFQDLVRVDDAPSRLGPARMSIAARATAAMAEAVTAAGLPIGIWAFGGRAFWRLKPFEQTLLDAQQQLGAMPILPHLASGSTPLGEAMELAAVDLLGRPEARKMLFCVTDGDPNNGPHASSVICSLTPFFEVVGVGIGEHTCEGLFDDFLNVPDIEALGPELIRYLQSRVVVQSKAAA